MYENIKFVCHILWPTADRPKDSWQTVVWSKGTWPIMVWPTEPNDQPILYRSEVRSA